MYCVVFSRPIGQDDEGYLLITVRGFLEGFPLYDSVFTQYGPLYYDYEWVIHSLLGFPITHDVTRFFCVAHWLMAAVLLGWAGGILTRSTAAGVFLGMQAIIHLRPIANEPGHPQELVAVLLALGMLVAAVAGRKMSGYIVLAVIAAALACIKVNVGFFFGLSIFLAMRCLATDRFSRGAWSWILIAGSGVLPFLLMRRHLGAEWCRNYSLMAAATVLLAAGATRAFSIRETISKWSYLSVPVAFGGASAIFLGAVLWHGTSTHGLFEALVTIPFNLPVIGILPVVLSKLVLVNAAVSILLAIAAVTAREDHRMVGTLVFLKCFYGVAGTLWLVNDIQAQFSYLLPWFWLALVPVGVETKDNSRSARAFLCLAAAWQGLQAYPIAGTQMTLATFYVPAICTLCLVDGLRAAWEARAKMRAGERWNSSPWMRAIAPIITMGILFVIFMAWSRPLNWRRAYAALTPLDLPGAARLRMDPETVQSYQAVTRYLKSNCDTFVMYPGFNSYYFWTGMRPPTQFNCTGWGLLGIDRQEKILAALQKGRQPLIMVHEYRVRDWERETPPQIRPLIEFVHDNCQEFGRIKPYIFFRPKDKKAPSEAGL